VKPRIIKSIIGENGKIIKETSPEKIRRIVSEKTATILKSLLVGVVENGTATNAKIEGIKIAGKTGTGQKSLSGQPGYSKTDYTSSFVGFWPADDPEFVCLVVIDSPRNGYFGGTVAAPAFRNIVERISNIPLRKSKIVWNNSDSKDNNGIKIPDVRYIPTNLAKNKLKNLEDSIEISGTGSFVFYQKPEPGKYLKNGEKIILTCSDNSIKYSENVEAPNLIRMSMREAINNIHLKNLKFKVTSGNGAVVEQSPKPGEIIKIGSTCYIRCADEINTQNTLAYK
jgi:membrane peptidoglycan carboxypeptidase